MAEKIKVNKSLFSFVFPAFNEEANIPLAISRAVEFAKKNKLKYEVVVVDDGSTDRTVEVIKASFKHNKSVRLLRNPKNLGYGSTVWRGLKVARGDLVFLNDSDLQFNLSDLGKFINKIDRYDVVIGYRKKRSEGLPRSINAWGWRVLMAVCLGLRVRDIDCAFKLFRSRVLKNLKIKSNGAMFSAELLYRIKRNNCRILELPVRHYKRKHGHPTGANPKVIIKAFRELLVFIVQKSRL